MHRRRSALSVTAVALLAAAPLLTGCGSDAHPGAAAVVDGDRITVSQVQAQARDVREAQRASEDADQLIKGTGRLSRSTLNSMIFDKVLARAAQDAGVSASRADVQRIRTQAERAAGGAERLREMWLQQYSIGPDQLEDTLRNQVLMDKLAESLGADRTTPEGQEKVVGALRKASESMGIDVNPRFGTWNDEQVLLDSVQEPWLRPEQQAARQS
ncbi:SurA N-terminal domain-containing protein [Streptomyces sp. F63]|uniref:SurA N-terminal domain-containing protein n=1 Tax=Streptomyces sp. F63 TaxID=2824887 RepID=UPI001B359B89|nr:SurA N-terminal domain-containing protein [Streptomyces sp. F63]MBQ0987236.1 SurA N-terminal domain-containing protein [Streptomyces sp. F63]